MYNKFKVGESEMCARKKDIMTAEHLLQHCQLHDALGRDMQHRTETSEGQALWQPGGAEENGRFREGDRHLRLAFVCLFVGCLKSQQNASVSQARICSDYFTCCHTEIEAADQTLHLTQSQYTDTGPTSPSTDPIRPGAWQSSHWSTNV